MSLLAPSLTPLELDGTAKISAGLICKMIIRKSHCFDNVETENKQPVLLQCRFKIQRNGCQETLLVME
jgi:hypothetical protein